MLQRLSIVLSVLVVSLLVLAACGGSSQTAAPVPTNTPVPVAQVSEDTAATDEQAAAEEPVEKAEEMAETESETSAEADVSGEESASEEAEAEAEAETETGTEVTNEVRTFVIVPEQSKASYIVKEEFFSGALDRLGIEPGLVDTIGNTQEVEGEMELDLSNLSAPLVSNKFTVNLRSLTSDQSRRDQRIRSANLESDKFPLAEFTITSLENVPESFNEGEDVTFQATGDITIREITQPAIFEVTAKLAGDTITGVATTQLKMTDFSFEPPNFANMLSVEDDFTAKVEFTFEAQ